MGSNDEHSGMCCSAWADSARASDGAIDGIGALGDGDGALMLPAALTRGNKTSEGCLEVATGGVCAGTALLSIVDGRRVDKHEVGVDVEYGSRVPQ